MGELLGEMRVGLETGRVSADGDPGEQVADDGRDTEAMGEVSQAEGGAQAAGERQDEIAFVHVEMIWRYFLRSDFPGIAPVCLPRSSTTCPLTITNSIPSLYANGAV